MLAAIQRLEIGGVREGQTVGLLHFLERPDRASEVVVAKSDGYLMCFRVPENSHFNWISFRGAGQCLTQYLARVGGNEERVDLG